MIRNATQGAEKMMGNFLRGVKAEAQKAESIKRAADAKTETLKIEIAELEKKKNSLVSVIKKKEDASQAKIDQMEAEAKDALNKAKTKEGNAQEADNKAQTKLNNALKKEKSVIAQADKNSAKETELKEEKEKIDKIADYIIEQLR